MAKYLPLPDGTSFKVPNSMGYDEAMSLAKERYPDAFEEEKPARKKGILAQASKGLESLISSGRTAGTAIFGDKDEAAKAGLARSRDISSRYEEGADLEKVKKAYEERGLLSAAGEAVSQVPGAIAEQGANIASLAASGRLGSTLGSAFGAKGRLVGGALGALASGTTQALGQNVERQAAEQERAGEPTNIDMRKAVGTAIPSGALDVAGTFIPFGGRIISKVTGIPVDALLGRSAAQVAKLAEERLAVTLSKGLATGALAEIPTEIAQQMLERYQAGLSLTDASAMKEYGETAYQVGLLAPLGAVGRVSERSGARTEVAEKEKEADQQKRALRLQQEQLTAVQQKAEEEAKAQELEAEKQTPKYAIDIGKQYDDLLAQFNTQRAAIKKPGTNPSLIEKAEYKDAQDALKELQKQLQELVPEYRRTKPIREQEAERARLAGMSPEEYMLSQLGDMPTYKYSKPGTLPEVDMTGIPTNEPIDEKAKPLEYATRMLEMANKDTYGFPSAEDNIDYLASDPQMAMTIIRLSEDPNVKFVLPGMSKKDSKAVINDLKQAIDALKARVSEQGQAVTEKTRTERLKTVEDEEASALEDQRRMREEYEKEQEDRNAASIAGIKPLTGTTSQGDLFGGTPQRVNMPVAGTRVDIDSQIAELQKELDVARSYGAPTAIERRSNRERVSTLLEQIRDLEDRKKILEGGGRGAAGFRSESLQSQIGELPEEERAIRDAAAARDEAYNNFKDGITDAKQDVIDGLLKEISLVRGKLKPETITEIEKELGALLDSSARYGNDITSELDAISTRWRAGTKYSAFGPAEAIPTTTTKEMLLDQIDRVYAQRERYNSLTMAMLDRIADDFNAFAASEDRRNIAAEWLNRITTTGRASPEVTNDLRGALRTLKEGKRSETEAPTRETAFGTAYGEPRTAVQQELGAEFMPEQVAPQAATRIVNGKVQYVAPEDRGPIQGSAAERYAPAQKGVVFESFAELNRYLASDYLKATRQEMGITRETVARMELQIKEHETKIANIRKQTDALKARKAMLEKSKLSEDRAAKNIIADAEVRMESILKRLSDELEPLRLEYMQVRSQVDQLADRSEETSRLIANNIANFKEMDDRAVDAAQETQKAKEELRQARNKLGSLAEKLPGIQAAQQKVIAALERQRNPLLYESRQQLQDLQKQLSKARVTQPRTVARLQKEIADLQELMETQRVNPYIPSSAFITFLNNDLRLQLDLREETRKLNKAGKELLDLGLQLELAAADLDVNLSTHPEIVAIKQEIGTAKEMGVDAVRALDNDLALLDSEIEKSENASYVESQLAKGVEKAIKEASESRGFGAQMADVPIEPLSSAERETVEARNKAQLEDFQASTARLQALSGQRIDFSKRREMLDLIKTATKDFAELDARIKEMEEGVLEMQVRVELVQIKLDEATEKAASYRGPRKNLKEAKALFAQIEDFKKQIEAGNKRVETLQNSIVDYEKSKITKQKALSEAERATSSDPEVYAEVTKLIDDRIAKLEKTISKKQEAVNKSEEAIAKLSRDIKAKKLAWAEGKATPETLKNMKERLAALRSSQKERRKRFNEFLKEREVLQARKSNRLGITRTDVLTGQNVGTLVREKDEETGEYRLVPRTKKAPAQIQEQIDAENERAAMYDYRFSGLQDLEKQMEGLSATPEPKTTKAKANRAERIRALQEKINQQIDLVNEVLPPKQEKISQATRVQSAAPSKFMTGTEQSKATPGFTKQPIIESRTPAPITSEKAVADANAFAERIAAAKDKATLDAEFKAKEYEQQNQILDAMEDNRVRLIRFITRSEDELAEIGTVPSGNPTLADRRDKLNEDVKSAQFMLDRVGDDINRLTKEISDPYMGEDKTMFTELLGTEFSKVSDTDIDTTPDDRYVFRTVTRGPTSLQTEQVERLAERITKGWVNAPEIVVVATEADLPVRIRGQIVKADRAEGTTPGLFDTKTKKVYLIANNLSNANDVLLTLAHEAAGHYGLRELLGDKYTGTMNSLYRGNPEVRKQADAKQKADKSLSREVAVEEVLAEMAEDPNPTPAEKSALRQLYERLRAWLRSVIGLPNITDAEVQQLVANARRYVIEGGVAGTGQAPVGETTYRTKAAYGQDDALASLSRQIIAQPKSFSERLGRNIALETEMNLVDMRAGLREALKAGAKEMGDTKNFVQAMYSVTKSDQKMAVVSSTLMNGPMELYTDEKGFHGIKSSGQNSAKEVFDAIGRIPGGNARGRVDLATTYMIAQRAANKGLSKLDLGALGITEADLKAAMADVNANPKLRDALEVVRSTYNAYNAGLIRFLASTGAITKAEAAKLLKDGDYVPFYRIRENGMADLVFSDEVTINIGDIRYQPYLAELKGGETRILPLTESIPRNTLLITDKALTNLAARNVGYAFQAIGAGKGPTDKEGKPTNAMPIHKGKGVAGADIIRFNQEPDPNDPKDTGERWVRVKTDDTIMAGIPAELIVKSLEGAHLTLPAFLKIGGIAGDILRSGVTRMPIYILRQLVRDPMAASFTGGLNYGPLTAVAKAGREFVRMTRGDSAAGEELIKRGLVQSGIFTGDPDDIAKMALQLAGNQQGAVDQLFAGLDRAAMRADAATRALVYDNARKNGLSEVEADMATMESMNFYKRGLSPTVQYASRLIPFFNAQIQGLNVLYKAATGQMPFEEQQKIKQKFFNNAMMLVAVGVVYAMAMEDDEYFKRAKPKDKYSNFFIPIPGVDEPFKLPIPYEAGWFFSLAVAAVDAMKAETDGKQQFEGLRDMFLQSVPGYSSKFMPQAIKPAFEVYSNKNFFSGNNIESSRMEGKTPQERFGAATTEAAKAMSKAFPFLSPVQIEHLASGYFGQLPLIVMGAANGLFRKESKGEAPEKRVTDLPFIGSSFQKKFGGADADVMYRMANESTQAKNSYDSMIKQGRVEEAREFLADNRTEIVSAKLASQYKTQMGRLRSDEERITGLEKMTAAEKRVRIDRLDEARQALSERFEAAMKRVEASGKT
jgi:phage shock protein A